MKYKYETHMHTSQGSACGRSTGAEMARAYKEAGYFLTVIALWTEACRGKKKWSCFVKDMRTPKKKAIKSV